AQEAAVALALAIGALAGGEDVRAEAADRVEPDRGAHGEDAAVPQVRARLEVFRRARGIRLLDEGVDVEGLAVERAAGADVAVARFRRRRRHAESDDVAALRERRAALDGALEGLVARNEVIRRHG